MHFTHEGPLCFVAVLLPCAGVCFLIYSIDRLFKCAVLGLGCVFLCTPLTDCLNVQCRGVYSYVRPWSSWVQCISIEQLLPVGSGDANCTAMVIFMWVFMRPCIDCPSIQLMLLLSFFLVTSRCIFGQKLMYCCLPYFGLKVISVASTRSAVYRNT